MRCQRCGFTLIELMVVIAIVAVTAGVASVSLASALGARTDPDPRGRQLTEQRRASIESGARIVAVPDSANLADRVLLSPDGSAVGLDVDLMTGDPLKP